MTLFVPRRSITIIYHRFFLRLPNAGSRIGFVISHDPLPQNPIEQIGSDEVRVVEVKPLGRLCPPRTVVVRFDRGSPSLERRQRRSARRQARSQPMECFVKVFRFMRSFLIFYS
jgi:hypothetical protein